MGDAPQNPPVFQASLHFLVKSGFFITSPFASFLMPLPLSLSAPVFASSP
jgi:hypothetical protein